MLELSLHILDAVRNAVDAGTTAVDVEIDEDTSADTLTIRVADNGRGMSQEMAANVTNPFVTTRKTRHVGLGLPLFAEAARRCDGDLKVDSRPGQGTCITATFRQSHIDRAPLGDMPAVIMAALLSDRPIDVRYRHKVGSREFEFDSTEVRRELGDVPLSHPLVREWMRKALEEGERGLRSEEASGARPKQH